ncbi:MAG: hypothetical protein AAF968_05245 [Pseudomonadota bacterium]
MLDRLITALLAMTTLAFVTALIALLIASRAHVEDMPFAAEIQCALGLNVDCLQTELAAIKAQISALEEDRHRYLSDDAVQTNSGDLGGFYTYVLTLYDDPDRRLGLRSAVCHAARDIHGPDHDLRIARMTGGRIDVEAIDPALARQIGFSQAEIDTGLAACPWPAIS